MKRIVMNAFSSSGPFQGWLLFGIGLALVFHFMLGTIDISFAQESEVYQGRSPEAVMEQFFESANEGVETRTLRTSISGDYAIATYIWGETGGFIVMQRENRQWSNICGGGGAIGGGNDLVEFCDLSLVDAQALWNQYVEDGEEAGYEF